MDIFNVETDDYGAALVHMMTDKLKKNKSTLSSGLSVGYDIDTIHNCVRPLVNSKNMLILAAKEDGLRDYLAPKQYLAN